MTIPKWVAEMSNVWRAVVVVVAIVSATAGFVTVKVFGQVSRNTTLTETTAEVAKGNTDSLRVVRAEVLELQSTLENFNEERKAADNYIVCLLTDGKNASGIEARRICGDGSND